MSQEQLLINTLNLLERVQSRMDKPTKNKLNIQEDIRSVRADLKEYMLRAVQQQQNLECLRKHIDQLYTQKQALVQRHTSVLQSLEMLLYQGDYHELRKKITHYKSKQLEQNTLSEFTPSISVNSFHSTLNRAFVEQENDSHNPFMNIELQPPLHMREQTLEGEIHSALKLIEDKEEPFDKKQEVWLGIVYTKNAKEQSDIFNSNKILNTLSSRTFNDPADLTLTEEFDSKQTRPRNKELTYSGKKIKSMTLLKEKSSKKKSVPKTSHKKVIEHKQHQNIEHSDEKMMKKKLTFPSKVLETQPKKKSTLKQAEVTVTRSFKKPPLSHA